MTRSSSLADSLSRVVSLLRDEPEDKEAQKSAFRALLVRLSEEALVVVADSDGRLLVDSEVVSTDVPGAEPLRRQLLSHGIAELSIPAGLSPANLLTVMRALAAAPGTFPRLQQLADHFTVSGIDGVMLGPPGRLSPIHPEIPPQEPSPESSRVELAGLGPDAVNEESVGLLHFVTMEMKSLGELDELLITLEQDPGSARVGDILNEVLSFGELANQKEQWTDLLRAAVTLIRQESMLQDESQRRLYSIAIKRLVNRRTLEKFAHLLQQTETRPDATTVLRRMGADSTEVLMQLLIAEQDVGQRRILFNAVTQMTEGTDLLVHMLGHDEWFVVRNVAELCGEMQLEAAVPALAKRMTHADERVRRAATSALARIASPGTFDPLRRALQDTSPAVRLQAAAGLEDARAKTLVPVLTRLIEEESHPEVQREMLHALGRIGTPDASEALIQASHAGRGFFKKKPVGLRVEAIEGLRLAGGPASKAALQDLEKDKDAEVSRAAGLALKSLMTGRK